MPIVPSKFSRKLNFSPFVACTTNRLEADYLHLPRRNIIVIDSKHSRLYHALGRSVLLACSLLTRKVYCDEDSHVTHHLTTEQTFAVLFSSFPGSVLPVEETSLLLRTICFFLLLPTGNYFRAAVLSRIQPSTYVFECGTYHSRLLLLYLGCLPSQSFASDAVECALTLCNHCACR